MNSFFHRKYASLNTATCRTKMTKSCNAQEYIRVDNVSGQSSCWLATARLTNPSITGNKNVSKQTFHNNGDGVRLLLNPSKDIRISHMLPQKGI